MEKPLLAIGRGKGFRAEDAFAINMGRRRHLDATVGGVVAPRPEFRHRLVGGARVGHVVARRAVVGLDRKAESMFVRKVAQIAGVVLNQ